MNEIDPPSVPHDDFALSMRKIERLERILRELRAQQVDAVEVHATLAARVARGEEELRLLREDGIARREREAARLAGGLDPETLGRRIAAQEERRLGEDAVAVAWARNRAVLAWVISVGTGVGGLCAAIYAWLHAHLPKP